MYQPSQFRLDDGQEIRRVIARCPFATLITQAGSGGLDADHLPLIPAPASQDGENVLWGHIARANPLATGPSEQPALAIFHGPQAYITPSWYPAKREHGRVVPTWNYEVVHAHGRLRLIDDPSWLRQAVGHLTARFEHARESPWAIADAPPEFIDNMCRAIVGIEFSIERLTGKRKASQHKSLAEREAVRHGLREDDGHSTEVSHVLSGLDRIGGNA